MPSYHKHTPSAVPQRSKLRAPLALLATAAALIAPVFVTSQATAGNGGIGSGGTGSGGGGGDDGGNGGGEAFTFPIEGRHTYGDGFGAGRNHQGQDVFAKCGKDLVAVRNGKVQSVDYHSSAGNYIVIDVEGSGRDYTYMHLKKKAIVRKGSKVRMGQKIGEVGETGNASGCHLHFEKWSAPGYYEGGRALSSVTKSLKAWDKYS